jgi:hypothetical protein
MMRMGYKTVSSARYPLHTLSLKYLNLYYKDRKDYKLITITSNGQFLCITATSKDSKYIKPSRLQKVQTITISITVHM